MKYLVIHIKVYCKNGNVNTYITENSYFLMNQALSLLSYPSIVFGGFFNLTYVRIA